MDPNLSLSDKVAYLSLFIYGSFLIFSLTIWLASKFSGQKLDKTNRKRRRRIYIKCLGALTFLLLISPMAWSNRLSNLNSLRYQIENPPDYSEISPSVYSYQIIREGMAEYEQELEDLKKRANNSMYFALAMIIGGGAILLTIPPDLKKSKKTEVEKVET